MDTTNALKDFKETGNACFNCANFLTCKQVNENGGLACKDHNKVTKEIKNETN